MNFTDTHSHLYAEEFNEDRKQVIENAISMGVTRMYLPNIDGSSIDVMLKLEQEYPSNCFAMMGLHPCYVKENVEEELALVEGWLAKRKFAAVGEIGLDFYWDRTFEAQQYMAFRRQIAVAKQYGLPIVIHSRNSTQECIDLVKEGQDGGLTPPTRWGRPSSHRNNTTPNPRDWGAEDPNSWGESGVTPGRAMLFEPEPVS